MVTLLNTEISAFDQLALPKPILKALDAVGYETPSPIQAQTIPLLLDGSDLVGQAQTGTGKTAAFALPALANIDIKQSKPQVLVLAPTRELAIQVAEAFGKYAAFMPGFHVLPVYGGQDYRTQIRALQRGVHVVVGTPGRVMDHIRRGNLQLDELKTLVLDEADEMLRMGFIDDVQWILEQTPDSRQTALFSATMPSQIRRIATRHLKDPQQITVKVKTSTAETIRQRYWTVTPRNKLDALTRILEIEQFDAMLIFVRTKIATSELSDKLEARGYACAPLNGDIQQKMRERTVEQLKKGKLDIIVATDVAARGLDVTRISHVLNYDIPYDTEAYIHRIGRTGRAGRSGEAIMFVAPREKRMLQTIERATGKSIELFDIPSNEAINQHRVAKFKQRISDAIEQDNLEFFQSLINEYTEEQGVSAETVAAALASQLQGSTPLLVPTRGREHHKDRKTERPDDFKRKSADANKPARKSADNEFTSQQSPDRKASPARENTPKERKPHRAENDFEDRKKPVKADRPQHKDDEKRPEKRDKNLPPMERYRVEVGSEHGAQVSNIVGAIANEAGIESQYIGRIQLKDNHSFVDLPEGMPKAIYKDLRKVWVCGQKLQISRVDKKPDSFSKDEPRKPRKSDTPKSAQPHASKPKSSHTADFKSSDRRQSTASADKPRKVKADKDGKISLSDNKFRGKKKRSTSKKQRTRDINKKRATKTAE